MYEGRSFPHRGTLCDLVSHCVTRCPGPISLQTAAAGLAGAKCRASLITEEAAIITKQHRVYLHVDCTITHLRERLSPYLYYRSRHGVDSVVTSWCLRPLSVSVSAPRGPGVWSILQVSSVCLRNTNCLLRRQTIHATNIHRNSL